MPASTKVGRNADDTDATKYSAGLLRASNVTTAMIPASTRAMPKEKVLETSKAFNTEKNLNFNTGINAET